MPILLAVLGAVWLVYVTSTLDLTPIKNSEGYLMRSEHSLLSREFYFGPRPFVTSLMYKLYGSTERGAVLGQLVFSTVSWLVLTFALGRFIESPLRRLLHCLLFPTLAAWWNVMGWNMVMRAESTAFSWLALWCAALAQYCRRQSTVHAGLLAVASFFLCFTRDSLPLLVLPIVGLVLGIEWYRARRTARAKRLSILAATLALTATFQVVTSQSVIHPQFRTRHEFPLVNVIIRRVLPNDEARSWFKEQGMPVHEEILRWKKKWASGNDFAIFEKKKYARFRTWVREEGKYTYLRYLLLHPGRTFRSAFDARAAIFSTNLTYYTKGSPDRFPFRLIDFWYPLITPSLALGVAVWMLARGMVGRLSLTSWAFACAIPLVFVNGILVFHMDAMEVERHALLGMVMLQIAVYALWLDWAGRRRNAVIDDASPSER